MTSDVSSTHPAAVADSLRVAPMGVALFRMTGLRIRLEADHRQRTILPWLGPAIRGWLLLYLKKRWCKLQPAERAAQGPYCAGCAKKPDCQYGLTWEGEAVGNGARLVNRAGDGSRPIWIWVHYPAPQSLVSGFVDIPIEIIGIRRHHLSIDALTDALRACPPGQIAGMRATLMARDGRCEDGGVVGQFSRQPELTLGRVHRLAIALMSPLFLTDSHEQGKKHPVGSPSFGQLVRASLRTVSTLFIDERTGAQTDWRGLKELAQTVETELADFEQFTQPHFSSRGQQRYPLRGCVGGAVYRDVPWSLIPWLYWGGLAQIGTHRAAGAGRLRLILDP